MFEKIKQKAKAVTDPVKEINDDVRSEFIAQALAFLRDPLPSLAEGEHILDVIHEKTPEFNFMFAEVFTLVETLRKAAASENSEHPDGPAAKCEAVLAEAESILAWLKTQPSTPENKALRAQAGIVVDYLKAV